MDLRANSNTGGTHETHIVDYTTTGKNRQVIWKGSGGAYFFAGDPGPSGNNAIVIGRGTWFNTADAITSLTISAIGVFQVLSRVTLYGLC